MYGHGFSVPTDFTEPEFKYIANTFKVFTVEKRHAYNSYGGNPSTERATIGTAAKLKAINPDIKVLLYWNAVMNYETLYESNAEFGAHPEWVHSIWATGYEIYDLENLACQDWWVNSIVKVIEDGHLDGVFLDAGPKADASGLSKALGTAIDRVRARIGNDKIVIYNGYRVASPTILQAGPEIGNHTSGVFIEFFLHDPLDTKEEAALLFDNLTAAYNDGKQIFPRGTPSSYLPGVAANNRFLFSFASFLLFYGPNSYWLYNDGYDKTEGMFDYYPEYYDIATGKSLSGPQRNGWVYTREFENYTITVDLEKLTANIEAKITPTGVSVSPTAATLTYVGATKSLSAALSPSNTITQSITWSSSNPEVATVNSSGLVTAKSVGSAVITATTLDGGFTDTCIITVISSDTPDCPTFSLIEGEVYNSMSGVEIRTSLDTGGGQMVGQIHNGDWCMYSNVDLTCATSVTARVASFQVGGNIEIRLDDVNGTLIGTISQGTTGGWQNWVTASANITKNSGVHNVYLVFTGGSEALFNFNWFQFSNNSILSVSENKLNESFNKSFKIFPNPATKELNILLNKTEESSTTINIFNTIGQMVISEQSFNERHTVDISKLPVGTYIIKITDKNNKEIVVTKFIKQ